MAWASDESYHEDTTNFARHDLVITHQWALDLPWDGQNELEGVRLTASRLPIARAKRKTLEATNPSIILLVAVQYRDADEGWLPSDSSWWQRDAQGSRTRVGSSYYMLDWHNPSLRTHVADQARAFVESGVFDGVMFDWWDDSDPDRIDMLEKVRKAIGEEALIIVNSNTHKAPNSAKYANGLFMESAFWANRFTSGMAPETPQDWQVLADTLLWAEANLRRPHINALETWYLKDASELNRMRATTTLALTHSDGYVLFGDSNHRHDWYEFWDRKELGRPIDAMTRRSDNAYQREFSGGTVIYNPMGNGKVSVSFAEPRQSAANGQEALTFEVDQMDGDMFLRGS
jgi:hypothetical protein